MKLSIIDKVLTMMKDYHLPAIMAIFVGGGVLQWFHRLDMSFVAFTGVIVGGITGHSYSPAGRPDPQSKPEPDTK